MKNRFQRRVYKSKGIKEISYLDSSEKIPKRFSPLRLFCYEETFMESRSSLEIHRNAGVILWALHFVAEGICKLQCEGRGFLLKRGNVFLNRTNQEITLSVPEGETFCKKTILILYSDALEAICGSFSDIESDIIFLKEPDHFEHLLDAIRSAILSGQEGNGKELSVLTYACLAELNSMGASSESELSNLVAESISRNPAQFANIDSLLRETGFSRRNLFRFFQKKYSCTPMQYVIRSRLEKSRWYLNCHMEMSIEEVARVCGYHSAGFFIREFKKLNGFTPNQYRKEHHDPHISAYTGENRSSNS